MKSKIAKAINFLIEDDPLFSNPVSFDDKWLDDNVVGNWHRNSQGKIVVNGSLRISGFRTLERLPWDFEKVTDTFYISSNGLTSLEGCPETVGSQFSCYSNKLTSLEGGPKLLGGGYYCGENELQTLKGSPEEVAGNFNCANNDLTSLEHGPKRTAYNYNCMNNKLTSLKHGPEKVGMDFNCWGNSLHSINGAPLEIAGNFISSSYTKNEYVQYKAKAMKYGDYKTSDMR